MKKIVENEIILEYNIFFKNNKKLRHFTIDAASLEEAQSVVKKLYSCTETEC